MPNVDQKDKNTLAIVLGVILSLTAIGLITVLIVFLVFKSRVEGAANKIDRETKAGILEVST